MDLKTLITFQDAIEAEKECLAKRPNAAKLCSGIYWICFYGDIVSKRRKNWRLASSLGFTKENVKFIYCN